jgi:hypothetical protein
MEFFRRRKLSSKLISFKFNSLPTRGLCKELESPEEIPVSKFWDVGGE